MFSSNGKTLENQPLLVSNTTSNGQQPPPPTSSSSMNGNNSSDDETTTCLYPLMTHNRRVIPNVGSTARDHLANERTYLAWIRTSLALIGASIGLLKWEDESSFAVEGYLVGVTGVVALVTSTWRYFHVMHLLQQGQFEPNVSSILVVVVVVSVTIVVAFCSHYKNDK
jgi:putative membrane protein